MTPRRSPTAKRRLPLTAARLAVTGGLITVLLAACGGGRPHAGAGAATTVPAAVTQRLDKAVAEQNRGDDAAAVADFLAVVKLDPHNKTAWYDLGLIAQQRQQKDQAINDYLQSLGADPNYVPSLYNLAILETGTNPADAQGLYQRILRIQPNNAAAHLNLGFLLLGEKQTSKARTEFTSAMRIDHSLASRIPKAMGGTAS